MSPGCAFCGAARPLQDLSVVDEKWSSRFGGAPVVALDHGWYTTAAGQRVPTEGPGTTKYFSPRARQVCDRCVAGWVEDVRWRAEPTVVALAEGRPVGPPPVSDGPAVVRHLQLTALLAELAPGLPTASDAALRHEVRAAAVSVDRMPCWVFRLRQRLPARVHLSQVVVGTESLLQVVSVDLALSTAVVVLASDAAAATVMRGAALAVEFGQPLDPARPLPVHAPVLDLARTPHPHRVAVHRLCSRAAPGRDIRL